MTATTARRFLCLSVSLALYGGFATADLVNASQKAPKPVIIPTAATFGVGGIHDEGGGAYYDGTDGVSSYRVSGTGSTNGWAWNFGGRSQTPRSLVYDLTNPDAGSSSQGVITIHTTQGQVYDLSNMAVGEVREVRASFHLIIKRDEYVLRFGQTAGDGSSPLVAMRLSDSLFHVTTASGDLARFLKGNGPGEILLGIYHVPIELFLANQ